MAFFSFCLVPLFENVECLFLLALVAEESLAVIIVLNARQHSFGFLRFRVTEESLGCGFHTVALFYFIKLLAISEIFTIFAPKSN